MGFNLNTLYMVYGIFLCVVCLIHSLRILGLEIRRFKNEK